LQLNPLVSAELLDYVASLAGATLWIGYDGASMRRQRRRKLSAQPQASV
jgi:hypothetical protein